MKKVFSTAIIALTVSAPAYSCPTCVGRLTAQSPAFFAQDYASSPETPATNTASSSQSSAAFLFNQQRKTAASVPLLEESDTTDSTGSLSNTNSSNTSSSSTRTNSTQAQHPLPTKK